MKDLVIIGSSGFAKEVAFLVEQINIKENNFRILGFIDNDNSKLNTNNGKYKIIGNDEWLLNYNQELNVAIGIGNPHITPKIINNIFKNSFLKFPNLIHPSVNYDHNGIKWGIGNIVCAGCNLTTDIKVENLIFLT